MSELTPKHLAAMQLFSNFSLWFTVCAISLNFRVIAGITSAIKPLNQEDKESLLQFVDWKTTGFISLAIFLVYGLFSLLNDQFSTPVGQVKMKIYLSYLRAEYSNSCLTLGSVLFSVGLFNTQLFLLIGGVLSWGIWLAFTIKQA